MYIFFIFICLNSLFSTILTKNRFKVYPVNKNREMPVIDERHIFSPIYYFPIAISTIFVEQKTFLRLTDWLGLLHYFPNFSPNLPFKLSLADYFWPKNRFTVA